jgi:Putative peptidoglycan binding domain
MKIKLLAVALFAGAALVPSLQAGNHHSSGGGSFVAARSGAVRGAPSFGAMPGRSFAGNRMIYSGQRFSPIGMRSPGVTQFRSRALNSNFASQRFTRTNQNFVRNGNFARNNALLRNQPGRQFQNGQRLAPNWRSHAIAQHSANWHSNWDRHRDHFFNHHRFVFIDGFWWGFDLGFSPWWWWDYPYYGYGYGYPYGYGYDPNGYGGGYNNGYNDPGVYDNQPADQNGYDQQPRYRNDYNGSDARSSANSTVAAVQDRLSRDGFYRGQIDGVMGPETRHAIVRFQTKHGLGINGELTPETVNAMGLQQYANSDFN